MASVVDTAPLVFANFTFGSAIVRMDHPEKTEILLVKFSEPVCLHV